MIRLDNISKQNGHQILFIDASMGLQKGEKAGLVGPNGAGKTTLFRMISGQEQPDDGQVTIDAGMTIGYFSQDVGEMSGMSAVAAVMDGVGPVSALAVEIAQVEAAMADPEQADNMDALIERYGEVQGRFEELDGYALDARAREVLAGLSFSQERMDGDVGLLSGGWKMRVALARILLMRPDGMLLDEPSNHLDLESLIWLEAFLKNYEGALLMTSHDREFMNRIVGKIIEIDGGTLITYSGNFDFYEVQRALSEKQRQAQFERQQAMLAKEMKFIERFKARASHAAQVQSRVKKLDKIEKVEPPRRRQSVRFEFRAPPRSGEDVVSFRGVHKGYPPDPGSIYHMTKTQDALFFQFYAKNDKLKITDLHQGIVWGTQTPETVLDERLINRFDYDGDYGTVLNRFLMQAAVGYPLTVHGTGGQTRAFIHIRDTVNCVRRAIESPPAAGDRVRIINQMTETHRIRDLAAIVQRLTGAAIENIPNPRNELEENELQVSNPNFHALGVSSTTLERGLLEEISAIARLYRDRADFSKIPCASYWTSERARIAREHFDTIAAE
ncbi:MAG: ATP-binding cassette domain-containing protein [Reyranella sp.]|nr:ATP-binding cassette domain-containing protein [Reyranella sp.]MDO8972377.1 ATP-binding cassette domain-containing protein [Reyranella sp.]